MTTESFVKRVLANQKQSVEEFLRDLGLSNSLIVLIAGKRANLDDLIDEGQEIIILPPLAGGL